MSMAAEPTANPILDFTVGKLLMVSDGHNGPRMTAKGARARHEAAVAVPHPKVLALASAE
jgi:hypothetical protein